MLLYPDHHSHASTDDLLGVRDGIYREMKGGAELRHASDETYTKPAERAPLEP
jgi:hypothetical protein